MNRFDPDRPRHLVLADAVGTVLGTTVATVLCWMVPTRFLPEEKTDVRDA